MISSLYNRFLFHYFPKRLLRKYTSPAARRMYFIREYELAYRQIWRAEFFKESKEEIREEIRREYDKANETLDAATQRLDAENKKEDKDKTILDTLQKTIDIKKKEISQFKEQIDHIDAEVKGYIEAIDSLHTTLPLIESYILQWEN